MASAWKKAKLGEIPRLLASALGSGARRAVVGDSPLVVQAGFPTSVADLVVKNRGRLKAKPPRWLRRRRQPCPGEAEAGCLTMASEILADPPPEPEKKLEKEEEQRPLRRNVTSDEVLESSRSEEEEEEATREAEGFEASTRAEPEKDAVQATNRRRFVTTPVKVAFLVFVLAIGTKKIALGVSISAFAILLLESMGKRLIPSPNPCEESKKTTSSTVAGVALPVPSSNGTVKNFAACCEKSSEFVAPNPPLEPKDRGDAEGTRRDQKGSSSSKKAKKLLREFVTKKLRWGKGEKGAKADPASDSSSRGASSGRRGEGKEPMEEEGDSSAGGNGSKDDDGEEEEQEQGGGGVLASVVSSEVRNFGLKDAGLMGESFCEPGIGGLGNLVFFLIVLSGLAEGRVAAMVLTVVCYLLVSCSRGLCKSWKVQSRRHQVRARCFHFGSFMRAGEEEDEASVNASGDQFDRRPFHVALGDPNCEDTTR